MSLSGSAFTGGSLAGGPGSPQSSVASEGLGLWVKEGREYAKGVKLDNTRWNRVTVNGSVYTVERAAQLQAKINLDEIHFTPCFEAGHEHKQKCFLCKMYFERGSVSKLVPNHRILDLQRKWNIPLEGRRYQSSSFIYSSSLVCSFCSQMFQSVDDGQPPLLPNQRKKRSSASRVAGPGSLGFEWSASTDSFSVSVASSAQAMSMPASSSVAAMSTTVGEHGFSVASLSASPQHQLQHQQLGSVLDAASVGSLQSQNLGQGQGRGRGGASSPNSPSGGRTKRAASPLRTASTISKDMHASEDNEKLHISTVLRRSDIAALGNRTYQSSTVDSLGAEFAVTPPYTRSTRTRREVDAWWEIDFSRRVHIDSVSLRVLTGHKQKLFVSVILLSKPTGFEDPFIDSVIPKSVAWREFVLPENEAPKLEDIVWQLPPDSFCAVIRVQARGIHSLCINRFEAFLGDSFVEESKAEAQSTRESYATMSLAQIKEARELMVSPEQKRERLRKAKMEAEMRSNKRSNKHEVETRLADLSLHISRRLASIESWKKHVLGYCAQMGEDFVTKLFHHVFVPAVNEGLRNGTAKNNVPKHGNLPASSTRQVDSRDLASRQKSRERGLRSAAGRDADGDKDNASWADEGDDHTATGSGFFLTGAAEDNQSTHSHSNSAAVDGGGSFAGSHGEAERKASEAAPKLVEETLVYGIGDSDLEDAALTAHYPRCDLPDLYSRIRGLLVQIQSRNLLKTIGVLGTDSTLAQIADESPDYLQALAKDIKALEQAWTRSYAASRDKNGNLLPGRVDPMENKGLSWAQFVVLFRLFMTKQFAAIRTEIFHEEKRIAAGAGAGAGVGAAGAGAGADAVDDYAAAAGGNSSARPGSPGTASVLATLKPGSGAGSGAKGNKRQDIRRDAHVLAAGQGPKAGQSDGRPRSPIADSGLGLGKSSSSSSSSSSLILSAALGGGGGGSGGSGGPLLRATALDAPLLFQSRDPSMPVLDTRFSEYKLSNFTRRVSGEMEFPRTLTLDFTQRLLEHQKNKGARRADPGPGANSTTSPSASPIASAGKGRAGFGAEGGGEGMLPAIRASTSGGGGSAPPPASPGGHRPLTSPQAAAAGSPTKSPAPTPAAAAAAAGPSVLEMLGIGSGGDDNKSAAGRDRDRDRPEPEDIGAPRSCALCVYTFPRAATSQQVLWKHVINLRRAWDPDGTLGLVSKDIETLSQGTSMFNLVHVCGFCRQYFDPDFEGGIAFPNQLRKPRSPTKTGAGGAGSGSGVGGFGLPAADTPNTDRFFDERFPLRGSNLFQDRGLLESRSRARFVLDLLAARDAGAGAGAEGQAED